MYAVRVAKTLTGDSNTVRHAEGKCCGMIDREKVIKELAECIEHIRKNKFDKIPCWGNCQSAMMDALALLKEQEKEIKALRLLVEWAEECDFGFDQFPDEYERYKDEITDMKYIEGMIHVAKRTLEDHGAFEEGW